MAKQNTQTAEAIGKAIARALKEGVKLPGKYAEFQKALQGKQQKFARNLAKGFVAGLTTPLEQQSAGIMTGKVGNVTPRIPMPNRPLDTGWGRYMGRQAGRNVRQTGKFYGQQLPRAIGQGAQWAGQQAVGMGKGFGTELGILPFPPRVQAQETPYNPWANQRVSKPSKTFGQMKPSTTQKAAEAAKAQIIARILE